VNNLLPLPVILPSSIESNLDIDVVDETGRLLGQLCCCTHLGQVEITSLTDAKYAAYINEVDSNAITGQHIFIKNYFVIESTLYEDYKANYLDTAPIWGGFLHENSSITIRDCYKHSPASIHAVKNISLPTIHHQRSSARGVLQAYGFERFLKYYHLLELLFDFDIVRDIKTLGDDLYGIGKILSTYENRELDRLKMLLRKRCLADIDAIASCLNFIQTKADYLEKGRELFFHYGKEGNPIGEEKKYDDLFISGGFSKANARAQGLLTNRTYEKLVTDTAAYWIYRIRCCIAHNRIGEYLMIDEDEEFVVEFAEPLIREVLCQAFQP
jgi:hypothetical protein